MDKKCFFYIDDVIWVFRDLTRKKPSSMFDNPFLNLLKEAHDKYGMKTQLNVFYQTDFFYGEDEFSLADMTDAYKKEWEESSDWLKMGFHSKQEFPDYPYINADYDTVKINLDRTKKEVFRFAGEKSFAYATVPHWTCISKEGAMALRDGGIKLLTFTSGEKIDYEENKVALSESHNWRFLHNRKPETTLFKRGKLDETYISMCGYNHCPDDVAQKTGDTTKTYYDENLGLHFKQFTNLPCVNHCTEEIIVNKIKENAHKEYLAYMIHEQYFYPEYFNYQPDYKNKILSAARTMYENGYTYIFGEDLVK